MRTSSLLALCAAAAGVLHAQAPKTVTYNLKLTELKYLFGPAQPVLTVNPKDTIDTTTVDAFGKAQQAAGMKFGGYNPLTGPFYVAGAEPGDTLVVRFLAMEPNAKQGWGAALPGSGGVNSNKYTPVLGPLLPTREWTYQIDNASNTATYHAADSNFSVKIPMHPFLGCVGVAPAGGEARTSQAEGEFGGNLDASEASVGNTIYLPVNVPGALLYIGDGHAAQGDGEIAGTAIEISMKVRIQVDVIKHQKIDWPRFENNDYIMTVGAYRPLDDAVRIAFTEMVHWIHARNNQLSELDAYELLSKTAEVHMDEMVDPVFVVVVKENKKFLGSTK
jgi:amidase